MKKIFALSLTATILSPPVFGHAIIDVFVTPNFQMIGRNGQLEVVQRNNHFNFFRQGIRNLAQQEGPEYVPENVARNLFDEFNEVDPQDQAGQTSENTDSSLLDVFNRATQQYQVVKNDFLKNVDLSFLDVFKRAARQDQAGQNYVERNLLAEFDEVTPQDQARQDYVPVNVARDLLDEIDEVEEPVNASQDNQGAATTPAAQNLLSSFLTPRGQRIVVSTPRTPQKPDRKNQSGTFSE